ncbi:MAG TPA: TAXI family TRAP transporter solute-binding subunit, partial [Hyphomicrobiaceae bacterium]|nr:TAXI family TRAP transporter solute-binding subunit [Hyphomicrobiaceae bacterium]
MPMMFSRIERLRPRLLLTAAMVVSLLGSVAVEAQQATQRDRAQGLRTLQRTTPAQQEASLRERLNENTVTMVTGSPAGTYMAIGSDMANVLDSGDGLRLLVIVGKGSVQNIKDVLYLRGVDLGIIQSDVLTYFKGTGELGPNLENRLVYLTRLYNEEFHIIARGDIGDIRQLAGQPVNFAPNGSGSQASARVLFKALGIDVKEVNMPQTDALLKMKNGEIAATLEVVGKPFGLLQKYVNDANLKLLPIPYDAALQNDYVPARLSHEDYPTLIAKGDTVETISVSSVLAAYNWPRGTDRHRRLAKFSTTLMEKFEDLKKPPRHPKWRDVNLTSEVGGWKRFNAVEDWLAARASEEKSAKATMSAAEWLKVSAAGDGGIAAAGQRSVARL